MVIVLGAFFALNVLDVITTHHILSNGGIEVNPVMAPLVESWSGYGIKLAIVAGVVWWLARHWNDKGIRVVSWVGVLFYVGVVLWNTLQI